MSLPSIVFGDISDASLPRHRLLSARRCPGPEAACQADISLDAATQQFSPDHMQSCTKVCAWRVASGTPQQHPPSAHILPRHHVMFLSQRMLTRTYKGFSSMPASNAAMRQPVVPDAKDTPFPCSLHESVGDGEQAATADLQRSQSKSSTGSSASSWQHIRHEWLAVYDAHDAAAADAFPRLLAQPCGRELALKSAGEHCSSTQPTAEQSGTSITDLDWNIRERSVSANAHMPAPASRPGLPAWIQLNARANCRSPVHRQAQQAPICTAQLPAQSVPPSSVRHVQVLRAQQAQQRHTCSAGTVRCRTPVTHALAASTPRTVLPAQPSAQPAPADTLEHNLLKSVQASAARPPRRRPPDSRAGRNAPPSTPAAQWRGSMHQQHKPSASAAAKSDTAPDQHGSASAGPQHTQRSLLEAAKPILQQGAVSLDTLLTAPRVWYEPRAWSAAPDAAAHRKCAVGSGRTGCTPPPVPTLAPLDGTLSSRWEGRVVVRQPNSSSAGALNSTTAMLPRSATSHRSQRLQAEQSHAASSTPCVLSARGTSISAEESASTDEFGAWQRRECLSHVQVSLRNLQAASELESGRRRLAAHTSCVAR